MHGSATPPLLIMKKYPFVILAGLMTLSTALAQFGGPGGMGAGRGGPPGPKLSGSTAKLFGENSAFSATMEMQTKAGSPEGSMITPGKMAFDQGKSRFEMNLAEIKGGQMPPQAAQQMKAMGMDKMVMISRPDKKVSYMIYPGLQAYVEMAADEKEAASANEDLKVETTELGKETVDGHPCIKNKAVVTDKEGTKHESLVWNATDLKKFPIKIEQTQEGTTMTMLFKNVSLSKPEASLFEPPSSFTKYDNMMTMMQQVMMKRLGGAGAVPGQPPGQ